MLRILLLGAGIAAFAQGPCASDAFKRYDYVLGEWSVSRDGKPVGNVRYRKAVHGCVIVEDYTGPGGIARKGLLFYDPRAGRWEIVVAGTDGLLEGVESSPNVFAAGGASFRLTRAGEGWSIAQDGAWKQVYSKVPYPETDSSDTRYCDSTEHTLFDFWVGQWEVFNPRGALAGTNHVYSAARGCALVENWTAAGLTTGISLNFWDAKRSAWRQVWVAPGGALRVEGKWDGAALRFASPVSRLTFTPRKDGSVHQFWEQTNDGGKTWAIAFDGVYRRATARTTEELVAELESSRAASEHLFEGLSDEQAKFRQAEGRWSLHEILDHLTAAESVFFQNAKNLSEAAADTSVSGFNPGLIEAVLAPVIANRNQRLNAPEPLLPKSAVKPLSELIALYRQRREASLQLARTGALRGHRSVHPLGASNLDAYQWLFTMAAHNRRHLEQAAEVFADPRYPGAGTGLRRWSGLWKGAGKFNTRDVEVELSIKQQLGGKFDELNINIKIAPGQVFQGRAMYGADSKASWSDSSGNAYPVIGKWVDGRLISEWGDPVRGRSTYSIDSEGGLNVLDEVKRPDGSYTSFGRYKLKKSQINSSSVWDIRRFAGFVTEKASSAVLTFAVDAQDRLAAHDQDKFYYVESGRGYLEAGTQQIPLQPGTLVHVQAGVQRRFHSISQPLAVLVVSPQ